MIGIHSEDGSPTAQPALDKFAAKGWFFFASKSKIAKVKSEIEVVGGELGAVQLLLPMMGRLASFLLE